MGGADVRIRIDKNQHVATRRSRAGIPCRRDLPPLNVNNPRAELASDFPRLISRAVIHHDDLVSTTSFLRRTCDAPQRRWQFPFLVVCGDHKRNSRYALLCTHSGNRSAPAASNASLMFGSSR